MENRMEDSEYISFAVRDIIEKYIEGENSEVIYGIVMSLMTTVYYMTEEVDRKDVSDAIMDIFESIDKGETDEFAK